MEITGKEKESFLKEYVEKFGTNALLKDYLISFRKGYKNKKDKEVINEFVNKVLIDLNKKNIDPELQTMADNLYKILKDADDVSIRIPHKNLNDENFHIKFKLSHIRLYKEI